MRKVINTRTNLNWLFTMAWRDTRTFRWRLLLYVSSIILGTASMVSIWNLGDTMRNAINNESKVLLGADLEINSARPMNDSAELFLKNLGGNQSRQVSFASMITFFNNKLSSQTLSRLVQVRALKGQFPYYGEFITEPPSAATDFQINGTVLVDNALLAQFKSEVGDSIRIGMKTFEIGGRLITIPGETVAMNSIGPKVYIPLADLPSTELIRPGSRATFRAFFKFENSLDVEKLKGIHTDAALKYGMNLVTVNDRKARLERSLGNLYRFLNLSSFIALVLGSIGVASGIHTYIRRKKETIAILRCLGAKQSHTFFIYLIQVISIGTIGSLVGAALGYLITSILPLVVQDFIPFELTPEFTYLPIIYGLGLSLLLALLFSLIPLLAIREITPLVTLRSSIESSTPFHTDTLRLSLAGLLVTSISLFAVNQTGSWQQGLGFTTGLIGAFFLLWVVAKILIIGTRYILSNTWPYVWRQGFANLFRPNNQTFMMVVALGLGAFLITTLYLVQFSLIGHISQVGADRRSNLVLFDIQSHQLDGITKLLEKEDLPIIQQTPVVSMRILSLKGQKTTDLLTNSNSINFRWALRREYRSTYRDHLENTETLLQGLFPQTVYQSKEIVSVSLEQGIADRLGVSIGDEITFDVQGIPIKTKVGSLRKVDWQRVQPNFFIVFPEGVLEKAPQFHVIATRIDDTQVLALFQQEALKGFPNVSMIDLTLILNTLNSITEKVSFIVQFMALFSIFTGIIVLVGVVTNSHFQRTQESVLLKTLGASKRKVLTITVIEYLFLGVISSCTGVTLAFCSTWVLATFVFNMTFHPAFLATTIVIGGISLITLAVGVLASRSIYRQPPLQVLRGEL